MDKLKAAFQKMGIKWTEEKEQKYQKYMEALLAANESVNLTSITDPNEFILKHYVDSLTCADFEEFLESDRIIDVGTGGGFPGIPLAIAFPEKKFVLIDSLEKRIKILREICEQVGITNVKTIHGRAEDLGHRGDLRERFDLCVSRAVANLSTLAEYCIPFVAVGGTFIAFKGPNGREEIEAAEAAIDLLGAELYGVYETAIDGFEFDHVLVHIEKVKSTPKKFPRKAGTPSKKPLSAN